MKSLLLEDLQASVCDRTGFGSLKDYFAICNAFLSYLESERPTRIISPTQGNYVFYQYAERYGNRITRPLNSDLFISSPKQFKRAFERFTACLGDLRKHQAKAIAQTKCAEYAASREINRVVYTVQQAIGSIGDSFANPNQSRKRVGQLFESLVKLVIQEVGVECEPRTIVIPIPGYEGYKMSYELDVVFSRDKTIIASETKYLHPSEIAGSVKTTSKDRIDKVFLDKFLLTRLLGRNVPVVAIFLHDVQRAVRGNSIFGVNSTFKTNHFLGYTVALNRLDGVYYVDPRPEMTRDERLAEQIRDFQHFLLVDLWALSEG